MSVSFIMPKFKRRDRNQNTMSMEINGLIRYHTININLKKLILDPAKPGFRTRIRINLSSWIRILEGKMTHKNKKVIFMF
jgi:hypothetical protein